jgi:hypothetical protein
VNSVAVCKSLGMSFSVSSEGRPTTCYRGPEGLNCYYGVEAPSGKSRCKPEASCG